MSIRVRVKWRGLEEIREALAVMPKEVVGAHLRDVVMAGAEVVKEQAVANAEKRRRSGTLAKDIHAEIDERATRDDRAIALVGPGKAGWYGRLLEMGHAIVPPGHGPQARRMRRREPEAFRQTFRRVPPYPWLRPALDERRDEAQAVMARKFRELLERAWRRASA